MRPLRLLGTATLLAGLTSCAASGALQRADSGGEFESLDGPLGLKVIYGGDV